jgi:hypothetical protein
MLKLFFVLMFVLALLAATAYSSPPHHNLVDSKDVDVQKFGKLISELVDVFEKSE